MYNTDDFEKLIKSCLSEEKLCDYLFEANPIITKQKYSNDEEEPFSVFVGGIGENDLVTVNEWNYPLTMKFDDKSIYIEFIKLIRKKIRTENSTFDKILISSIKNFSRNWFYHQNDEESIQNAKLAKIYIDKFKSSAKQRDGYAGDPRVSNTNEQQYRTIYGISKFKGTGNLAKCVEVNSVTCNLLAFSGFESVLIQGYLINYNGKAEAHTFPLYKNSEGNYNLLDCMLKQQRKNVLLENVNFEQGFEFKIPITLTYKDGSQHESIISYKCLPQRMIEKGKKY